jgi:transglutaminase-like putative cysteine protease
VKRALLFPACAAVLAAALSGCATFVEAIVEQQKKQFFHDAGPAPAVRHELARLPFSEYWTGIVFNGEKIGFARTTIRSLAGAEPRYEIASEASFVLRFLALEKKVRLRSRDVVRPDLTLIEFSYDYHLDGSELSVRGRRDNGELRATIVSGGVPTEQRLAAKGPLYPSSAIALYPVVHGLERGREYRFPVYNGELQAIAEVVQRVEAYEKSPLFSGSAFRVETRMREQRVSTWIDPLGRPVLELALHGVMIAALEEPEAAQRYLALASLNKKESLVEFSLIRPQAPIVDARAVAAMSVALEGPDATPPSDEWQRCERRGREVVCRIARAELSGAQAPDPEADAAHARYLEPSVTVQSRDSSVRRIAERIASGARSRAELIERIVRWIQENVERAPLDVFSALDVLEKRRAECQGHAYLYTALARALGIPTRVVNGIVYSQDFEGFLYHSWAESLVGSRWIPVDPTFGQTVADATHIKLIEGERLGDLLPLLDWVGKAKIRVLSVER